MKTILCLCTIGSLASVLRAVPTDKTLNLQVYDAPTKTFKSQTIEITGQNGKVLGIVDGQWTLRPTPGTGDAVTGNPLSQFAPTSSAQLAATLTDESGTGRVVFSQGNLTIGPLKTLTVANTLTLAGADGATLNIGTGGVLGTGAFARISDYLTTSAAAASYQPVIIGAATTITGANLAAGRALTSDATGKVAASPVTTPELGYLSGLSGPVQNQLNAKVTSGLIHIVSRTGATTTFSPSADTDVARGFKLLEAAAAATSGQTIVVSDGTYSLRGNRIALGSGVHLRMSDGTRIISTADLLTDGAIIYPGDNSTITGGTVEGVAAVGTGGASGYQAPIGIVEDIGDAPRNGVVVTGTKMIGDTDGFYIQHNTACSATLRDVTIQTKWDAIMISAADTGPHTVDVYNPRITITGPSAVSIGIARGITSDHQAVVQVFGGSIITANGGVNYTAALATINSGTIRAFGTRLHVFSPLPRYDANNLAGTIQLAACTGSGPNGALLTRGAIVYAGAENADNIVAGTLPVTRGGTGVTSFGTGVGTWLGAPTSANLAAALTDENGSGKAIFSAGTLAIGAGQTLTVSNNASIDRQNSTGLPCEFCIVCSDETTPVTAGRAKVTFRAPYAFTLTELRASVTTAPAGRPILIGVNESGAAITATKVMIDASEKTSRTAATPCVISDSAIADDAEITIDFDQIGSGSPGTGVKLWFKGYR